VKTYRLTFGQLADFKHPRPEATAHHQAADGWDTIFQVWPNRKAMLKTVEMQRRALPNWRHWTPLIESLR